MKSGSNSSKDQAINTLRTAEATMKQASNLRDSVRMQQIARSTYKKEGGMRGSRASTEETETISEAENRDYTANTATGNDTTGVNARHPARIVEIVAKLAICQGMQRKNSTN